jgi:3',5'-cyclic AMP phosphodiesterase CpdA
VRTVAHLSDLHFGADDPVVVDALIQCVRDLEPHVVAVSGDLTQRARASQFRRASAFLDALPFARVVVPGNHDIPLYNLLSRFGDPLRGFRRYISPQRNPSFVDSEIALIGADTTRSFTLKDGGLTSRDVAGLVALLEDLPTDLVKIIVCHHPFDAPVTRTARLTVPAADREALSTLVAAGADIFLTGHLHLSQVCHTAIRYLAQDHAAIAVEAGSATSIRRRGENNSFNLLRIEEMRVVVQRLTWNSDIHRFSMSEADVFVRSGNNWIVALGNR